MHTLTPISLKPAETAPAASAALKRLGELSLLTATELNQLPAPHSPLLDAIIHKAPTAERDSETSVLLQQIDDYWSASSTDGETRYQGFLANLQQALHDEISVKLHEGDLDPAHATGLHASIAQPQGSTDASMTCFSLHIHLQDELPAEIAGALVMTHPQGHTLLALPGVGIKGFNSQRDLCDTLVQWLGSPTLQHALLGNLEQQYQDPMAQASNDPDLYNEPFALTDIQLQQIPDAPFAHAMDSLLNKQREDIRHACLREDIQGRSELRALIQQAINMRGLFGPAAMLELRELKHLESQYLRSLPDWIKNASGQDLNTHAEHMAHHQQARMAVHSVLGAAASPLDFARAHLRMRLADDFGFALEPDDIIVSTHRHLPVTGESYTVTRSLVESALYGLHPSDSASGSDFLERTRLSYKGAPLGADYALLDTAYLARLIDELDVRGKFSTFQRTAYQNEHNQALIRTLARTQITELAHAAQMQGHIQAQDFDIVEALANPKAVSTDPRFHVQQIKLGGLHLMSKLLVFRKDTEQGRPDRLIMVAMDAPHPHQFWAFDNVKQLLHELVSWAMSDELCDYLLQQVDLSPRPALEQQLSALRLKPYPQADYVQLVDAPDYETALQVITARHTDVALSRQALHTPEWYLNATPEQRQQLVALEDAATGALYNYQAMPGTRVPPFEEYVHERATQQISKLLGVPYASVDPDLIVITTERETLTYTDLLRNGYDDSLDPFSSSADLHARFNGPKGVDISMLTPQSVTGSVRGKWLADDYLAKIRATLLNPDEPGYESRRLASVAITQLQMRVAALRSHLKGQVDGYQYEWLRDAIENAHLSDAQTREQYPLYPLQLEIDKPLIGSGLTGFDQLIVPGNHVETVLGCIAILPTRTRQSALLYTPQAPDGIEFRLFSDFVSSLSAADMIDYYKDRCRLQAGRILSFFLKDMQQGNASKAPFLPGAFIADFADTCFNQPIERKLRETDDVTTGRNDMLTRMAWISVELVATALTLPFPTASFAVGTLWYMHDSVHAFRALAEGDGDTANTYVISALLNGLGAAGDISSGLRGFGGVVHRLERRSSSTVALRTVPKPSAPPRYEDLFPVTIKDQPFLIAQPNANGHMPVFHTLDASQAKVEATGQFVKRQADGLWQPLGPVSEGASGVRTGYAVDVSLHNVPRNKGGHGEGVCTVNGKHYIDLSGSTFAVQFDARLRCWQIIDPANPFAFFGKQPVRLNEKGIWQKIDRQQLRGGGLDGSESYKPLPEEGATAGEAATGLSDYEMPGPMQPYMYAVLSNKPFDPTGMGMEFYFQAYHSQMRETFAAVQDKLYQDANQFFAAPVLPPRPALPTLAPQTGLDTLIENLFAHSNGVVIGEAPQSIASKRLLILNMPLLAEQGVEVLYVQHLFTDKHQVKLDRYRQLGGKTRSGSREIKHHLRDLSAGELGDQPHKYDYYHLIKAAHKNGIEVRPYSSSASYRSANLPVAAAVADPDAAMKMSNFFGHTVISADAAANPSRRWLALLDQKLVVAHNDIPGIAALEGAISVHIEDIAAGYPMRVIANPVSSTTVGAAAHSDFTVRFSNPMMIGPGTAAQPTTLLDQTLLRRLGSRQLDEAEGEWAGDYLFLWDESHGWQRTEPEHWVPNSPMTAIQQSLEDTFYDMPFESRGTLHTLASFEHRGLDQRYFFQDEELGAVREKLFERRKQLQQDARIVIDASLPARPSIPEVPPGTTTSDLLETLFQHTDAIVVGEAHASIASKKLIIDNLPLLAQHNVKTLYLEHVLTDLHQADLDRFFETGQMSKTLLHDLQTLDLGHHTDPQKIYTFEQLVNKAQRQGIEIRAIDCAASYHIKGIADDQPTTRQQMMNFFASRTIRKHQDVMGSHKWIALVGNSHSNTYERIVPGLAELEGGIGLRVVDVEQSQPTTVIKDPGAWLPVDMSKSKVRLKGDYLVSMGVYRPPVADRPFESLPVSERLSRPGMFLLQQDSKGSQSIVHRSRDTRMHTTPVHVDTKGKVFIERPTWASVHGTRYDDTDGLIDALRGIKLTFMG
ncbi:membrane-targeted effector domain-containing toxin [Pseudomonas sp. CDFA 602]|uniref:membrane-targeted effector domain-containing toxin n=1 Tax=Pseudomonas californiensis TaxID=2829823 RepID=UPI001E3CE5E6|nr:membrane-targeted effector domain-containing toxin [Pseudomonas californiensis]MCD5994997.1 membrane-targeted effector domain-containing toxin [Pseudomonas californiensis]MCD6000652.1 membrane-targeted effector domain-containing toxin [Pseudomonas californiensis]